MYNFIFYSGICYFLSLIHSYRFISINSNTKASRLVGSSLHKSYYKISTSLIIYGFGDKRRKAYISLKVLTYSIFLNLLFMHLIATKPPVCIFCAFKTSLKVPSPLLPINRYSRLKITMHLTK